MERAKNFVRTVLQGSKKIWGLATGLSSKIFFFPNKILIMQVDLSTWLFTKRLSHLKQNTASFSSSSPQHREHQRVAVLAF